MPAIESRGLAMADKIAQRPLEELLGSEITDCACGKVHRIPTREAALSPGSINKLPQMVERHFASGPVLCVVDANTWAAAGETAAGMLRASGRSIEVHYADHRSQPAHADAQSLAELVSAAHRSAAVGMLAVGSGTINDLCKSAATAVACPLITVATAASMNGYPSAISALTVKGVKITEPCAPPVAIIADPVILATAPGRMTGAGFGDLLSKNASGADWIVSHLLFDDYFCPFSAAVAENAVARCIANADAIRENRPEGLQILAEALLRSGIAMVIAGSSSPASGGEHLISHLWDMTAHWSGRTPALHGEQTGVSTLISLGLYEKLLALDGADLERLCARKPESMAPAVFEDHIRAVFRDLAAAVLPFARQKHLDRDGLQQRRKRLRDRWPDIRKAVAPAVIPADESRAILRAAGAVSRAADLGVAPLEIDFAYRYARWIRNRYTVLDLAAELGMLEAWQADVLQRI
jgi:glycerol-1-phosphate dehydrogenase [NAD(P)+]